MDTEEHDDDVTAPGAALDAVAFALPEAEFLVVLCDALGEVPAGERARFQSDLAVHRTKGLRPQSDLEVAVGCLAAARRYVDPAVERERLARSRAWFVGSFVRRLGPRRVNALVRGVSLDTAINCPQRRSASLRQPRRRRRAGQSRAARSPGRRQTGDSEPGLARRARLRGGVL